MAEQKRIAGKIRLGPALIAALTSDDPTVQQDGLRRATIVTQQTTSEITRLRELIETLDYQRNEYIAQTEKLYAQALPMV